MATLQVKNSLRKKRRDIKDALGDDIIRYIVELVLNSDDSYRRMENRHEVISGDKVIYIELKKERKGDEECFIIMVTDNAEGMFAITLQEIFGEYGGDNAGGIDLGARGIFGQGASDVMRSSAKDGKIAMIETIKDGKFSKLKYRMDEDLNASIDVEEISLSASRMNDLRKRLNIPNNGTRITFGVPSTVKFKKKIYENLADLMNKCSSFRYLLSQTDRKVIYKYNNKEEVLSSKKYIFDESNQVLNQDFNFNFENKRIDCNLKLYKNNNKDVDETNIIVRDQNYTVFDNTMFDFGNNVNAQNISGELVIQGLYDVCYEHLNLDNPDAIVRDNRTGFDTKNSFYVILNKTITPIIQKTLEEHGQKAQTTTLTNNKKFRDALKVLNKYLNQEFKDNIDGGNLKGLKPPVEGIKFARNTITITKGKTYDIKLYINPELVSIDEEINIDYDDNDYLEISPFKIQYEDEDNKDGIVVKNVTVKALEITVDPIVVIASVGNKKSIVAITVVEEEIHYPENGLEFYFSDVSLVYNKVHKTRLYFDSNIIPIDSEISLDCNTLKLPYDKIKVQQNMIISQDGIGCVWVESSGGEIGEEHLITAKFNDIVSSVNIKLIDETNNPHQGGGLISDIQLEPNEKLPHQAYIHNANHILYINPKNPINIRILGSLDDKNPNNPSFNKEQMRYLCDIIATQVATFLTNEKNVKKGEIDFSDVYEAAQAMQRKIQEHKNKLYVDMYKALMPTAENE